MVLDRFYTVAIICFISFEFHWACIWIVYRVVCVVCACVCVPVRACLCVCARACERLVFNKSRRVQGLEFKVFFFSQCNFLHVRRHVHHPSKPQTLTPKP